MDIQKSTRHPKITGDFGEILVLYWLSKYGFECSRVDHTGIDLIAKNPKTKELMGISVKSRSRNPGKEYTNLTIPLSNIEKVRNACNAFDCIPYFAFVVDATSKVRVFITSLEHLLVVFPPSRTSIYWKMRDKNIKLFYDDPQIMIFELDTSTYRWW